MAGKRILIIEDEQIVARDLQNLLRRLGHFPVGSAASGADAIRLAQETLPDLILMDVQLEGDISGLQASIEIARQHPVPIIYITAYTQSFITERAHMVYPFLCVAKPFSAATIEAAVKSVGELYSSVPH